MNKYLNDFYSLKCYPEILEILEPISGEAKEITEAMAIIKQLRKITLKNPTRQFYLYDFCAGNALTSTIASFLLKNITSCYAIDKRVRDREWHKIKGFYYINSDIKKENWEYMLHQARVIFDRTDFVIVGVHPCRDLAKRIIEIYNKSEADHLFLMPCCTGDKYKFSLPDVIKEKVGNYLTWCVYLLNLIEGPKRMIIDENIISPKNAIIIASKEK